MHNVLTRNNLCAGLLTNRPETTCQEPRVTPYRRFAIVPTRRAPDLQMPSTPTTPVLIARNEVTKQSLRRAVFSLRAQRSNLYAAVRLNRDAANAITVTPIAKSHRNCGHSTLIPAPLRKIPRMISRK